MSKNRGYLCRRQPGVIREMLDVGVTFGLALRAFEEAFDPGATPNNPVDTPASRDIERVGKVTGFQSINL